MKTLALVTAATAAALLSSPVIANPAGSVMQSAETGTTTIDVGDIDLTTAEGRKELGRRVQQAANEVCRRYDGGTGSWVPPEVYRKCKDGLEEQAWVRIAERSRDQQLAEAQSVERIANSR